MSFLKQLREELAATRKLSPERAFVRDNFMKCGSISNPERTYHLEFFCDTKLAILLHTVLADDFGLSAKSSKRRERAIVYLKEADDISDCLKIMGATKSLLCFEDMRVKKQVSNDINRKVNFEAANLDKVIKAAVDQIEIIKELDRQIGLSNIPKNLQELARFRLENENLSLLEIGAGLNPPIGKSGVNHRMRKLKCLLRKLD